MFASIKVFGLHRSSIPGGLQSSVGCPAELLCAVKPAFVLPANLCDRDWMLRCWPTLERLTGIRQYPSPGTPLKLAFLDANFPILPAVQYYDFSSLIYSLLLSQSNISHYFYSNCGENKKWDERGNEGYKWRTGKMLGLQVPGVTSVCVYVYVLQCRAEKPKVSFSTACNPIRRITLLS